MNSEVERLADRAWLCVASNRLEDARKLYSRICEIDNNHTGALMMLGKLYAQSADSVEAEHCFRKVIALDPLCAEAYNRLAAMLLSLNQLDEAERYCRHALSINPDNAEIYANFANVLAKLGRLDEAATNYRKAIRISPDFIGAYINLADTLKLLKEYDRAAEVYRRILEINPRYIDMYNALGGCYLESGEPEKSLECYRAIIRMQPRNVMAYMNMGFIFSGMGAYEDAIKCYESALEISPENPDACLSRGLNKKKQGQFGNAASSYRKVLELQPENLDAQISLSLVELSRGNYTDGWRYYTARRSVREQDVAEPGLLDDDLYGKHVLVIKDQGLGDEIFFLRFVRQLKERGARLTYLTDSKIKSLVSRLTFIDEVKDSSEPLPECDIKLSIGDLPFCLGFGNDTPVPPPVNLSPLKSSLEAVHNALSVIGTGPYTGITWWARTRQAGRLLDDKLAYREIPVDLLASALRGTRSTVLVLQRSPLDEELSKLRALLDCPIHDLSRFNDDLDGMLALLSLLDEYIGVDNTNMHLSASVGKPCRILVPHPPEWRVMFEGAESPWFPGFSLYRQSASGDWSEALEQLGMDLESSLKD